MNVGRGRICFPRTNVEMSQWKCKTSPALRDFLVICLSMIFLCANEMAMKIAHDCKETVQPSSRRPVLSLVLRCNSIGSSIGLRSSALRRNNSEQFRHDNGQHARNVRSNFLRQGLSHFDTHAAPVLGLYACKMAARNCPEIMQVIFQQPTRKDRNTQAT